MEKMKSTQNKILIKDVMLPLGKFPVLNNKSIFAEALEEMCKFKLGIACIINSDGCIEALITDGDIRRKLLNVQKPSSAFFMDYAIDHGIKDPFLINNDSSIEVSLALMEQNQIWDIPVIDEHQKLVGLLHLHPVVKALINLKK